MAVIAKNKEAFLKFFLIFVAYLCYTHVVSAIFSLCGVYDSIIASFTGDLIFFIAIIYIYKDTLSKDLKSFLHDFKAKRKLKIIFGGFLGIVLINFVGGMITEVIFPGQDMTDENTDALYTLGSISTIYTVFKVALFSIIAEELVFRKTTRDVMDDKLIYVITSSLIYALMNIAYADFNIISVVDLIQCFIIGAFVATIYVKTDNIVAVMLMKFVYTLVPLTIMLSGLGV